MARKFHRRDRLSALTEINVTPLIDLAFALLIIFMITTPLLEQTIEVNLPVEAAKSQPDDREDFQSISINQAGLYYWGEDQVSQQQLGDLLDTMAMDPAPPVLSIRADSTLPYQKVITVIDMIKQRKLSKISLDTKVE
ncbi:biopolymer transporter ExbD [Coraliomargarita sinensis]|uniref:Biopolymer transporter ExbD n=1 Tax=Coraliomargarita sinensis TaxID=2174842 RepID=A0A317ZIP2_9BACT|nr:biopolymer transporter ExbD [Coraliomargarita sinensis]PXA05390.1 biopolymer transporter ExbD [Coraliomargarita sinensis]